MLHLMTGLFNAGFYFPGYNWTPILPAIPIGIIFGGIWSIMQSGPAYTIGEVWGTGPSNVFAVGTNAAILHYNGSAWSNVSSGTTNVLTNI